MKVILDANFLVDAVKFGIDLNKDLAGNEVFVTDSIVFELEKIIKGSSMDSGLARIALIYVKAKGLKILKPKERNTDSSLVEYAKKGYAIATHDKELKKRIKKVKGKVIFIRQKRYLVFE